MTRHRLDRRALHPDPRRSQRDPRDFYHGLLGLIRMRIVFLTASLLVLLTSMIVSNVPFFAIGMVSFIVALTATRSCSRLLLLLFWIWMNLVLVYLCGRPVVSEEPNPDTVYLLLGLPVPAFWMLFGIWIFPVLLWPLGFALTHKQWMRK